MSNKDMGLLLIALAMIGVGVFFILTPAEHLVRSDRKTGYGFFLNELKASGDEKRALAAAAWFYRLFGGIIVLLGIALGCLAFVTE